MAGTIICDFIRTDANQLSLNVGNTTFATINAGGFYSNTGVQIISPTGAINAASIAAGSIPVGKLGAASVSRTNMYSGAVLQAVQNTSTTSVTNNGGTYASTGVLATITPTSTSSRIYVVANLNVRLSSNGGNIQHQYRIDRNGTTVFSNGNMMNVNAIVDEVLIQPLVYIDSPSSTSALTYTIYFATVATAGPYGGSVINPAVTATTASSIQLLEIAG